MSDVFSEFTRASCLDTCNNTARTYWKYPHCQAAAGQPYSGTWTVWYFMNGRRGEDGGEERMRGYWGLKKERERERSHVCLCTHKSCFLFLQVVIRRALTHSTHMEHFQESDSLYFKGTWCRQWVSEWVCDEAGFHRLTCCEVHNLGFRINVLGFWENYEFELVFLNKSVE